MLRCHQHTAVASLLLQLQLLLVLVFFISPTFALPATTLTSQLQTTATPVSSPSRNRPEAAAEEPTPPPTPVARSAGDNPIILISNLIKLDAGAASPATPPPYTPLVTPPPDQDAQLAKLGYSMTTFYTCNTIGGQEHCGWHVPVIKVEGQGPVHGTDIRVVLAVVTCMAGMFAWGLL